MRNRPSSNNETKLNVGDTVYIDYSQRGGTFAILTVVGCKDEMYDVYVKHTSDPNAVVETFDQGNINWWCDKGEDFTNCVRHILRAK
jgi:hypothetical protein